MRVMPEQGVAVVQLIDDVRTVAIDLFERDPLSLAVGNPASMKACLTVVDCEHSDSYVASWPSNELETAFIIKIQPA